MIYALAAVFREPESLVEAAKAAREEGYKRLEAYTPYPVEGLRQTIGPRWLWVAPLTLMAGITGGMLGFGWQWFDSVFSYRLNVAGRPYFSWPSFVPVSFELTVLFAGLTAGGCVLILNRLPRLHHPIFNCPGFERASVDRFYLVITSRDSRFDPERTRRFLEKLQPESILEVPLEDRS